MQLRGSYACPAMYTPFAVRLIANGTVDAKSLITHAFELKDMAEAMRVATEDRDKVIKVVVVNR